MLLSGGWDFTCRQIGRIMTELKLVPNMVQVTNVTGAGGGIAYSQIVSDRNDDPTVFVAVDEHSVVPRTVVLGAESRDIVEIKSGVKAGERVVIEGVFALKSELFR